MKVKTTILIAMLVAALLLASCDPSQAADILGKTQTNVFSDAIETDTSSATQTSSASTSAVDKDKGNIVPETMAEKESLVTSISETVSKASASKEKQEALEKELSKPVDAETKVIMQTCLSDLNEKLAENDLGKAMELPEEPTVLNLLAMQMVSVVVEKASEANSEDPKAVEKTMDVALQAVETLSSASKIGKIDVLAIALPYISDLMEESKAITADQIPDDAAKYGKLILAVFNEVIKASDSDGDTYLDAAGLSESMIALTAKRISYESAGVVSYSCYDSGESMYDVFCKMEANPKKKFSLGNLLDYVVCVAMTEFDDVFGSSLNTMLSKNATDAIRKYIAEPTKDNLAELLNKDEFSGFEKNLEDFDFGTVAKNKTVKKTLCAMVADLDIEAFSEALEDILKEEV